MGLVVCDDRVSAVGLSCITAGRLVRDLLGRNRRGSSARGLCRHAPTVTAKVGAEATLLASGSLTALSAGLPMSPLTCREPGWFPWHHRPR